MHKSAVGGRGMQLGGEGGKASTADTLEAEVCVLDLISDQLLRRNLKWFRGGLVCKAHRLVYHSTLGFRVKKKKKGCVCVERLF